LINLSTLEPTLSVTAPDAVTLAALLATKADNAAVVHNTGTETVAGVKTFTSAPVVPTNSFPETSVTGLVADLAAKQPLATLLTRLAAAPVTVTYAASVTLNASLGCVFRVTATGNLTLTDITNGVDGQAVALEVFASGGDPHSDHHRRRYEHGPLRAVVDWHVPLQRGAHQLAAGLMEEVD
jgi:hypothetical protein